MKNKIIAAKDHFLRHRFAYGALTGFTISSYFFIMRTQVWNDFLAEHDLLDEFYMMDEEF